MAQSSDVIYIPTLPSFKGFSKAFSRGAGKETDKQGKILGGRLGTAMVAGVAAAASGVAAAGAMIYQTGRVFEDVTNSIRTATGATGADLDSLVESAQRVGQNAPLEFEKIGEAIGSLNTYTGATGSDLEAMATQVMEASRMLGEDGVANADAFGQAMQQWQIPAEEGGPKMDALFKATQDYGMGLDTTIGHLNTYGSVLNNAGFSMEESAALFGQLESSGLSVSRVMPGLNSAFRNWAAEGKDVQEEMGNTVEAMKNAETGSEALSIATEAFGAEGAQRLTTAVRSGTLELDDLSGALSGAEGLIADTADETMRWQDHWQVFKNNVMVWLKPLAEKTMQLLADGMEGLVTGVENFVAAFKGSEDVDGWFADLGSAARDVYDRLKDFGNWISENRGPISAFASVIGGMAVSFGLYRGAVAGVTLVKKGYTAALAAARAAQTGLNTAMRANPIGLIITLIGGLVAGLTWFFTKTEAGQGIWEKVWGAIKSATSAVVDWFTDTALPALQSVWDGIMVGLTWLNDNIIQPVWSGIKTGFDAVVQGIKWAWENILSPVITLVGDIFSWLWENIAKPIFGFIGAAWSALVTGIKWYWDNILSPVINLVGAIFRWLWNNVAKPVFGFIGDAWGALITGIQAYWNNVLSPVINLVGAIFRWLWNNVARPVFDNIGDSWQRMANWLRDVWRNVLRPVFRALGDFVVSTYRNYIRPAFNWIRDRWDWLTDKISGVWNNRLKPIFQAVGDFVKDDVVGMVRDGVDRIDRAWRKVANFFRDPINGVIDFVWNDGIAGAFNSVSKAVGIYPDTKLPDIPHIPEFAKGGRAGKGWAMVGEEGPELVNFSQPGRVYTADETRDALTGAPGGIGSPSAAKIGAWLATTDNAAVKWGRDAAGNVIEWARGNLADAAESLVRPLLNDFGDWAASKGTMGQLAAGMGDWGFDTLMDWVRGKDEEAVAAGNYDGEFTANPGGFNRPAQGMISSMAGTRSYWGAFGNQHYGVDIANSVGSIVRAAWDGVVKRTSGGGLDRMMVLNHGSYDTAYLHNSGFLATPGQEVSGGQPIARMGSAGTGPHLHFELHPGGWYNPSVGGVNNLFRDKGGLIYPGLNQVMNGTGKAEYAFNQQQFDNLNKIAASGGGGGEGWQITQNNYQSNNQHRDAQDLRMTFRRERRKAGV